jgi:hypothetical protein
LGNGVQWNSVITNSQGIAGLDCWIAQSGLQSSLVDLIVIDNPKSKTDFGFGLSIQFLHFNPNPNNHISYEETKNSCSILLQQ